MVKDNILDWFRNEFIPNVTDNTLASLIFLYSKYGKELTKDEESQLFVQELCKRYKNTPVQR